MCAEDAIDDVPQKYSLGVAFEKFEYNNKRKQTNTPHCNVPTYAADGLSSYFKCESKHSRLYSIYTLRFCTANNRMCKNVVIMSED